MPLSNIVGDSVHSCWSDFFTSFLIFKNCLSLNFWLESAGEVHLVFTYLAVWGFLHCLVFARHNNLTWDTNFFLLQFLFEAAITNCVELATDRHGCCVLQKCLSQSDGGQRHRLIYEITSNALVLSQDPFGYVNSFIQQDFVIYGCRQ